MDERYNEWALIRNSATSPAERVRGCLKPQRISDELAREKWGSIKISHNGVHKVLRWHGLNTKAKRLGLVADYAAPYEPNRPHHGRLTKGRIPEDIIGKVKMWAH